MTDMLCKNNIWAPKSLSLSTCITSVIICVITCIGNGLIITTVYKDPLKKLRTPFNFFLVNLSVADLIVGAVTMPISAYGHYQEYTGYMDSIIAKLIHLSSLISGTASLLSLMVLSLDRYFAVAKAIQYRKRIGWTKCALAASIIWAISLSVPFLVFKTGYLKFLIYFMSSAIIIVIAVMVTVYVMLRKTLKQQSTELKERTANSKMKTSDDHKIGNKITPSNNLQNMRMATEKKVTRLFFLITAVFTAIYLPAAIMIFLLNFCKTCSCTSRHVMRDVQFLLTAVNSLTNPFVCTLRSTLYKRSLQMVFGYKTRADRAGKSGAEKKKKVDESNSEPLTVESDCP